MMRSMNFSAFHKDTYFYAANKKKLEKGSLNDISFNYEEEVVLNELDKSSYNEIKQSKTVNLTPFVRN